LVAVEPRARGVEQARERLHAARVLVEHEEIEGALVDAQERRGELPRFGGAAG
jgi:hypothetical protein